MPLSLVFVRSNSVSPKRGVDPEASRFGQSANTIDDLPRTCRLERFLSSMSDLVHCIYASVQTHVLAPCEIDTLVEHSRRNNRLHNITGILLHVGSTFFQILEGPPATVDALYERILVDPRHKDVTKIIYEPIARRFFADFTMSLATLSSRELASALEEDSTDRMEQILAHLDEGRAKRLLRAFSQGRWRARLAPLPAERQSFA